MGVLGFQRDIKSICKNGMCRPKCPDANCSEMDFFVRMLGRYRLAQYIGKGGETVPFFHSPRSRHSDHELRGAQTSSSRKNVSNKPGRYPQNRHYCNPLPPSYFPFPFGPLWAKNTVLDLTRMFAFSPCSCVVNAVT